MIVNMNASCEASDGRNLLAHQVREFIANVPDGAHVTATIKDFGTQRDPEPTLVGLRAAWSEVR